MKRICLLAASAWLGAGSLAAAAQPLPPTAKWVVDYAESQCVASRAYGTADEPLALAFKPSPMGDVLQLTVVKGELGGSIPLQAQIRVRIGDHPPIEAKALAFNATRAKARLFRVNLPIAELDRLAGASVVSVEMEGRVERSFALSQMKEVAAELTKCLADLRTHWNIGAENPAKHKSRPMANLASYFNDTDYPDVAIRNEEDGTVHFVLLIDETGKVADCTIIQTSNVPLLDAQTCGVVMTRAKFEPAIGADGKPVRDAVTSKVTWRL